LGLAGLLVALAIAGCSGATASLTLAPLITPTPTGPIIVPGSLELTTAPSEAEQTAAATIKVNCPSAAVVGAALDLLAEQAPTGPTISSTQVGAEAMTTCNYSGTFRTMVSFAIFGSPADAAGAEASTEAMQGSTAVPGLGDAAFYVAGVGVLDVFIDPVSLLQISCSNGPTEDQLEALARTVLAG